MKYPRYLVYVYGTDTSKVTSALQVLDPLVVKHPSFRDEFHASHMKKPPLSINGTISRMSALRIVCRVPDEILLMKLTEDETFHIIVEDYKEE